MIEKSKIMVSTRWLDSSDLVFHYTKLSTALEYIFPSGKIEFGTLSNTNDPYEKSLNELEFHCWGHQGTEELFKQADLITRQVHQRCRFFSTTLDDKARIGTSLNLGRGYAIPSLWAHYAEDNRGICLAFDKAKLSKSGAEKVNANGTTLFGNPITYSDPPGYFSSTFEMEIENKFNIEAEVINHIQKHYDKILFTKDKMWRYEKEHRFVVICNDAESFSIDFNDSLVGVFLGCKFPDSYAPLIVDLVMKYQIAPLRLEWKFGVPNLYVWPGEIGNDFSELPLGYYR